VEWRVRVSTSDGAEAALELELDVEITGDPDRDGWRARVAPGSERPPAQYAEGPVVVTAIGGSHDGARADAAARVEEPNDLTLVGTSRFVDPDAPPT
jgi:hypothetical protein